MNYLEKHYDEIFKKFTDEELLKDIQSYRCGKGKLNKVLRQWFEECIFKCIAPRGNKSPWDALQNNDDVNKMFEIISRNTTFYNGTEIQNIKSFIRNGGQVTRKVANFCPKNARDIYFRYHDINGHPINCLDTSAGFGSRMSAVLLSGHNYYGIDPNEELFNQLFDYWCWLYFHDVITDKQICELKKHGSEIYIPKGKDTDNILKLDNTNCNIIREKVGYNNVLNAHARDNAKDKGYKFVQLGMLCDEAYKLIGQNVNLIIPYINDIKRIVIPVGSGTTLIGITRALQKHNIDIPIIGVMCGMDATKNILNNTDYKNIMLVKSDSSYHKKEKTWFYNITLNPIYEAKCVPYLQDNDLFYIVA